MITHMTRLINEQHSLTHSKLDRENKQTVREEWRGEEMRGRMKRIGKGVGGQERREEVHSNLQNT